MMREALSEFYLAVGDFFFELAGVFYRKGGEAWRGVWWETGGDE